MLHGTLNSKQTFDKKELYSADETYNIKEPTSLIERTPPPRGDFLPIYHVPSSRTVSKRTPLEAPGTNSSRGVLLLTAFDEGT